MAEAPGVAAPGVAGGFVALCAVDALARKLAVPADDPRLVHAVWEASGRFRSAVGYYFSLVEDETLYLDGSGSSLLQLPAHPVRSVTRVLVEGVPLVPRVGYRVSRQTGILRRYPAGVVWPKLEDSIEVTYSHGHAPTQIPEDAQTAVSDMAEALFNVEKGLTQKSVLGDSSAFGSATVGTTQQWADAVSNHHHRTY